MHFGSCREAVVWHGIEALEQLSKFAPVAKADDPRFCARVFDVSQNPQ